MLRVGRRRAALALPRRPTAALRGGGRRGCARAIVEEPAATPAIRIA